MINQEKIRKLYAPYIFEISLKINSFNHFGSVQISFEQFVLNQI